MADPVEYRLEGHVATITLNRPDKRNAFDADLVRALAGQLRRLDEDDTARVAILTGAGKAFSSGADVNARQCRSIEEFERLGGPQEPDAHSGDLLTRAVKWKPVIAAPHGYVMGLAVGIVLECDIVVAEAETKFQITETPRGLGGARYWGLAHFCGAAAFATEVALTGRFFSAEEAQEAGLIARVCPKNEHLDVARQLAQSIARHPPLSVRSTVRSRRYFMDLFERKIAAQTDPMKLYLTEDFREAVRAYLEKREPEPFHGR
jgi:enoyl-CoA hydratase/carnithine racemase